MKNKRKRILLAAAGIIAAAAIAAVIWYRIPVHMLKDAGGAQQLEIFDNTTGNITRITDRETIREICNDIQGAEMTRSGFGFNYTGPAYSLSFQNGSGSVIEEISLDSSYVRQGDFLYKPDRRLNIDRIAVLSRTGNIRRGDGSSIRQE